jgi:hypothetical protein
MITIGDICPVPQRRIPCLYGGPAFSRSQDLVISAQVFWPCFLSRHIRRPGHYRATLAGLDSSRQLPGRGIARLAGRAQGTAHARAGRRHRRAAGSGAGTFPQKAFRQQRRNDTGAGPGTRADRHSARSPGTAAAAAAAMGASGTASRSWCPGQRTHGRGLGLRVRGPRHVADRAPASGAVNCRQCQPAKLAIGTTAGLLRFCAAAGARVRVPTLGRPFAPLCSGDLVSKPNHSQTPVRTDPEFYFW